MPMPSCRQLLRWGVSGQVNKYMSTQFTSRSVLQSSMGRGVSPVAVDMQHAHTLVISSSNDPVIQISARVTQGR